MKRFLKLAVPLLAAFLAMNWVYDAVNLWLVRHATNSSLYKMERLFDPATDDDVAMVGSSRAYFHLVPSVFAAAHGNARCFNYGVEGSRIRETLFHVREAVKRRRGGLVLVNLDPWGFADWGSDAADGFHSDYLLAARHREVRQLLPRGLVGGLDWLPGVRFQGKLKCNLADYLNSRRRVTKVVDNGVVLIATTPTPEEWKVLATMREERTFVPPNADALRELAEIDRLLQRPDAPRLVWCVAPSSPLWSEKFHGRAALAEFLSTRDHLNFFDYPDFTAADFRDLTHLNLSGARKYTAKLAAALRP